MNPHFYGRNKINIIFKLLANNNVLGSKSKEKEKSAEAKKQAELDEKHHQIVKK